MKPSDLLRLLQAKNISRSQLANLVGKSDRTIRRWLSGASPIPSWVVHILNK